MLFTHQDLSKGIVQSCQSLKRARTDSIVRGVVRKQREPASHVMVFMVSPEDRVRKPYAVPVQINASIQRTKRQHCERLSQPTEKGNA